MSDWKIGAAKRRDARNTKTPNEVPKPAAGKKDTKRWCGGKVGREHKTKCVDYSDAKHSATDLKGKAISWFKGWKILICTVCGKELAHYSPMNWPGVKEKPAPDWAK